MHGNFFDLGNEPTCEGGPLTKLLSTPRVQFAVLLLLTLFLCLIKLDAGGLAAFDECLYAQKAKEMVLSGDWLTQRYMGAPEHQNPWLHTWMIASSFKVFGISEWAARFPTCMQTVLIILLTYLLVHWLTKRPWVALLASSCLLFSDYFFKYARKAHMDHLVTLLFLLAVIGFILGRRRNQRWFILMGVSAGLAVLTKSLLGLMPLAVIAVFIVLRREWSVLAKPLFWLSLALAIAVGSSWYLYEYSAFGGEFVEVHFGRQLFGRTAVTGGGVGVFTGAFLVGRLKNIYLFIRDAHIWFVLALLGAVLSFRRGSDGSGLLRDVPAERLLVILWTAVPVVLVSFTSTFRGWYLMPVYVPLAILAAFFFSSVIRQPERLKIAAFTVLGLLLLYLAVLVVTPLFTLDPKHEIRHPGIRKLATKARMIGPDAIGRVMYFPATREIAGRHGLETDLSNYFSFTLPWNFYSDIPMDARGVSTDLEEVREYLSMHGAVCLTTVEGFLVISDNRTLQYEIIGRAKAGRTTYVLCCSRQNYRTWRAVIETDHSRAPLYPLRDY